MYKIANKHEKMLNTISHQGNANWEHNKSPLLQDEW